MILFLKKYWQTILVIIVLLLIITSFFNKRLVVDYFLKEEKIHLRDSLTKERDFILQRKIDSLDNIPAKVVREPYKAPEYENRKVIDNLKILEK